jgi:CSLREA domain-containing protein
VINRNFLRRLSVLMAFVLMLLASVQVAYAKTITVNTTVDEMVNNSTCSLREAIIAANTDSNTHEDACMAGEPSSTDFILLPANSHFSLTIAGSGEDNAMTGDLDVLNSRPQQPRRHRNLHQARRRHRDHQPGCQPR